MEDLGWADHFDFLGKIAKPCLEIIKGKQATTPGGSKLGGSPDLPPGWDWPHDAERPYRFLAQFHFDGVRQSARGLPLKGLLSFFGWPEEEVPRPRETGFIRAFHFPDAAALQPVAPPSAAQRGKSCAVELREGISLPHWPWSGEALAAWPLDEAFSDDYEALRAELCPWDGYLLGYPTYSSLAYDPTPAGGWSSLLTVRSNRELAWSWHDGGWLMTFVEDEKRDAGDFSIVRAVAG